MTAAEKKVMDDLVERMDTLELLVAQLTRKHGLKANGTNGNGTRAGGPVDPSDLPVIRFVRYGKPCGDCAANVPAGGQARWNPDAPGKPLYCNACRPLPAATS